MIFHRIHKGSKGSQKQKGSAQNWVKYSEFLLDNLRSEFLPRFPTGTPAREKPSVKDSYGEEEELRERFWDNLNIKRDIIANRAKVIPKKRSPPEIRVALIWSRRNSNLL